MKTNNDALKKIAIYVTSNYGLNHVSFTTRRDLLIISRRTPSGAKNLLNISCGNDGIVIEVITNKTPRGVVTTTLEDMSVVDEAMAVILDDTGRKQLSSPVEELSLPDDNSTVKQHYINLKVDSDFGIVVNSSSVEEAQAVSAEAEDRIREAIEEILSSVAEKVVKKSHSYNRYVRAMG